MRSAFVEPKVIILPPIFQLKYVNKKVMLVLVMVTFGDGTMTVKKTDAKSLYLVVVIVTAITLKHKDNVKIHADGEWLH